MKKIISVMLVLAFMLSLGVSAYAASAGISSDKTQLKKGETVNVTLSLSDSLTGITNFEYNIYFDSELFELQSSEKGQACSLTQISALKSDAKGSYYSVSFVDTTSEGVTIAAGTIYTLCFKAIKDVTSETTSAFTLNQASVMDTSWGQVSDATVGTGSIGIKVESTGGGQSTEGNDKDILLTISAPASVEKTAGTAFNAIVYSTAWNEKDYKLLDCVVDIPAGLEVTAVTAGDRLSGGTVNFHADSENKLRIVYYNDTYTNISLKGTEFPAPLFTVGLKTTSGLTADSATITVSGASLKLASDSAVETNMKVLTIGTVADDQGNTGSSTVSFTSSAVVSVTAAELFAGDGIDIIPADKKGIVVSFSGLGTKNIKLTYKNGDKEAELFYNEAVSKLVGNLCYVAVVNKDEVIGNYANWANYTRDTSKAADEILFGDTNADKVVNAQDALNEVNVWLRVKTLEKDSDYMVYNVNSDARINTFDALGIEEAFVNNWQYKIVTRAAALVSGS